MATGVRQEEIKGSAIELEDVSLSLSRNPNPSTGKHIALKIPTGTTLRNPREYRVWKIYTLLDLVARLYDPSRRENHSWMESI